MTKDDIIRMAQEVGMQGMLTDVVTTIDEIERFASLVEERAAAAEREACAEIAEKEMRNTAMLTSNPPKSAAAWDIRNAIRARGEV